MLDTGTFWLLRNGIQHLHFICLAKWPIDVLAWHWHSWVKCHFRRSEAHNNYCFISENPIWPAFSIWSDETRTTWSAMMITTAMASGVGSEARWTIANPWWRRRARPRTGWCPSRGSWRPRSRGLPGRWRSWRSRRRPSQRRRRSSGTWDLSLASPED